MSEVTDLTVIEIKPDQAPALYVAGGLDAYLEQIRQAVNEVPDLSTKKGRDRVASLAAQVSRSKTAVEKPGRDYLRHLKEATRLAEEKRIADEAAARAADVEHRRAINAAAVQALIDQGIPEDWAKACVVAIARGKVPATTINY